MSQNSLLGQISNVIPRWIYSEADLRKNNYKMYYKPYATLKIECQGSYSTEDLAISGKKLGDVSDMYLGVFICSIVLFIVMLVIVFLVCSLNFWVVTIVTIFDLGGHAALIALFSKLQNTINTVDIYMYEYLRDNQCTDGALARAIEMIANSYANDMKVISVGLAFALGSFAASLLLFVCSSNGIRTCLSGCS